MIDLNKNRRMGWRPYMGQATATFPAAGAAPATAEAQPYFKTAMQRLLWFGAGTAVGFPIGILANTAFKSLRRLREEAAMMAALAGGIGLAVSVLPFPKSDVLDMVARISGILTGSAMADIALPHRKEDAIIAPVI